ncbi:hypothetical protein FF011L_16790 [Roseimaritima multifibrata]|uniref:Signal peptidase I n=1 Tax=Roseimaritima multifibrata TaxID=1930274 RepID=A0A517MDF6_9BACT|nr:DUF5684 domain-containing protein [Roseimaritima multifibrata]QDS92924.1 hypothetical protein FF011L_16790 [Roseimaritima multifibrata]
MDQQLNNGDAAAGIVGAICGLVIFVIYIAVLILVIAGMWKVFVKAGKPGWAAIVPIYNIIVLLEIAKRPLWWVVLFFIPLVNFIIAILVSLDVAKYFGKSQAFGLGLAFLGPIFFPILGFGDARYLGNSQQAPPPTSF